MPREMSTVPAFNRLSREKTDTALKSYRARQSQTSSAGQREQPE
jgi:hypothetical protein